MPSQRVWALVAVCATLWLNGCSAKPTYPKERLAESLQQILNQDHLQASVRLINHTLAMQLGYPGSLTLHEEPGAERSITIGPKFDEANRKALTAMHRVLLSSDAEVRFYVLLLSDPKTPGAYLTIVRYVDDVRRFNASMIDIPEMYARTIFELNFVRNGTLSLDEYVPRDIQLEEFLSWQLTRRIQQRLTEDLELPGVAKVGRCAGQFENGEFAFSLDVSPIGKDSLDDDTIRVIFQNSTNVVANVLKSYHFNSFEKIRLVHPFSGRNFVLPKTKLDLFR